VLGDIVARLASSPHPDFLPALGSNRKAMHRGDGFTTSASYAGRLTAPHAELFSGRLMGVARLAPHRASCRLTRVSIDPNSQQPKQPSLRLVDGETTCPLRGP
jgi:hypothetical protein